MTYRAAFTGRCHFFGSSFLSLFLGRDVGVIGVCGCGIDSLHRNEHLVVLFCLVLFVCKGTQVTAY